MTDHKIGTCEEWLAERLGYSRPRRHSRGVAMNRRSGGRIYRGLVESNRDSKVLPISIKANLDGKEDQIEMEYSPSKAQPDELLLEVVEDMTTACKAAGLTKKITYEIWAGNPADEIIDMSNLIRFDLIVMGSRRIASMIGGIGSTTRKVISTVKTPILIVQKQQRYKDEW